MWFLEKYTNVLVKQDVIEFNDCAHGCSKVSKSYPEPVTTSINK